MASAGRRRRRGRRREAGQAMEVDAQEKEDSVKSPDCIEGLARKYMQKCMVESSTESESESRAEVVPSPVAGGLKKAKKSRGLQFSDPYDGDSEDASVHAERGVQDAPWANSAPKAVPLKDADTSEDEESFPDPPKVGEICSVHDCRAALELPCPEKDLLQSLEPPPATAGFTPMGLTPMVVNPSVSTELPAIPAATTAQQTIVKRKQGIPAPEGASEKLKRKKFRAT